MLLYNESLMDDQFNLRSSAIFVEAISAIGQKRIVCSITPFCSFPQKNLLHAPNCGLKPVSCVVNENH